MPGRRILLINYFYPPVPANVNRWPALAAYLRRLGHEVSVLTTASHGGMPEDSAHGVVRTNDLASAGALRRLLRRPALAGFESGAEPLQRAEPKVLTHTLVPDSIWLSWGLWAMPAARRLLTDRRIDCVVTSTPAESTALMGAALRSRVPWLCDMRDPWTFERMRAQFPTEFQRRLDRWLERTSLRRADAVTAVQHATVEDLRERFGVEALRIPNGHDPTLVVGDVPAPAVVAPGTFRLVHTGTMSGVWGRDPSAFFTAAARVATEQPRRVRVVLSGRLTENERAMLDASGLGEALITTGLVPRPSALALQRSADLLVLFGSDRRTETPGKLLEYLAAGRPILALGLGSESARIVEETRTGAVADHRDPEAIATALRAALNGDIPFAPRRTEAYLYPRPAEAMAAAIERAIAQAARRGVVVG